MNEQIIIEEVNNRKDEIAWLRAHSRTYPEILYIARNDEWIASTLVRKEYRGVYYLWHLLKRDCSPQASIPSLAERIMSEAYSILVLGKVDPNLGYAEGNPVFVEDPDQTPEPERFERAMRLKSIKDGRDG